MTCKTNRVTTLLEQLCDDVEKYNNLNDQQRCEILGELKVRGRDVQQSGAIFQRHRIKLLGKCAFRSYSGEPAREAMRCLANALLLSPPSRQMFVDEGFAPDVATMLKTDRFDEEMLCSRLLFLLTYETKLDFVTLIRQHNVAASILKNLNRHVKLAESRKDKHVRRPTEEDVALQETLKLVFNLSHLFLELKPDFEQAIKPVFALLGHATLLPETPLQPTTVQLINALTSLEPTTPTSTDIYPDEDPSRNTDVLIHILDIISTAYGPEEMEQHSPPLLLLIRRLFDTAPEDVKSSMQRQLLPTDEERDRPLGQSKTLFSRLLRLSMSSFTPALRESISGLLFELSDKNVDAFVKNVGYGFAAGFLANNNINIPMSQEAGASSTKASGSGSGSGSGSSTRNINPVTGQYTDQEKKEEEDDLPPMTDKEKEREAERLFVLFERLKKNGIISVRNPVEEAMRSGKFEEVE